MDAADWRRSFGRLLSTDTLGFETRRFVEESLRDADGHLRGVILAARAAVCYMDGPGYALEGLRHADEAMELLEDDPIERLGVLLTAHALAWGAGLVSRSHRNYHALVELRVMLPAEQVAPWTGRLLLAIGQHHMLCQDWERAGATLRDAVTWHREHLGPFGEHDRRCYLGLSLLSLGTLALRGENDPAAAELCLDEARAVMPADTTRTAALLEGEALIALARHEHSRVLAIADQLEALGRFYSPLAHQFQAEVALHSREIELCQTHALAGMKTAACLGDWVRVEQLQQLLRASQVTTYGG